jgi:gliding motility-associated-like protein
MTKYLFLFIALLLVYAAQAQVITTVAGNGTYAYTGNNIPATNEGFDPAQGIAFDKAGNLYIADELNERIWKVTPCGIISAIAGNGYSLAAEGGYGGYNGDGIQATAAELNAPANVAFDKYGNMYISDVFNNRIRKVDTFGIITTVAGNGYMTSSPPYGYGAGGFTGDGGPATDAELFDPEWVTVDTFGNIYISDKGNLRVRKVNIAGIITTVAGNGIGSIAGSGDGGLATAAGLASPDAVAVDDTGNVYISDNYNVRKITISTGIITKVAGTGAFDYSGDGGAATAAGFEIPYGIVFDSLENMYIGDYAHVRKINTSGIISTVAGNGVYGFSGDGGPATAAEINGAIDVKFDPYGNLYISDELNYRIRAIIQPCSNIVASNITNLGRDSFCVSGGDTLVVSCAGIGVAYQWQSSTNGADWTNVGAGLTYVTDTLTTTTYFRNIVTCTAGNISDTTKIDTITILPNPTDMITGGPATYCYGTPFVPFTVAGQNILWTSAAGDTSAAPPVINTFSPGTYMYTVASTVAGCTVDTTIQVIVYPQTPPPTVHDTGYCAGSGSLPLNVQGSGILWYAADTGGAGSSVAPAVPAGIPGIDTFYVSQTINGCESGRDSFTITINPGGAVDYTYSIRYGCQQDTVIFNNTDTGANLYIWSFGDGIMDTSANPVTHIYPQGTYVATLFGTSIHCGDAAHADTIALIHPVKASFTVSADTICQGQTINFYNASIGTQPVYFWDFGDGFNSITDSTAHTFNLTGVYTVMLEENDFVPCFDTAFKTVYVDSVSPISMALSDTVVCEGKEITFTGGYYNIGNIGNVWTFGDGSTQTNSNPIQHAYDTTGVMLVTLTANYRVCPDTSITRMVTIKPYPQLDLGPDTSICPNSPPVSLNDLINAGNPLAHWLWSTGDTTSGILAGSPAVYYTTVTINGCSATDSVWVKNNCYINIPNAFTPNGDGVNDYFFPRQLLTNGATAFSMNIYNRWGQEIFETTNTEGQGWDGKFNNEAQPEGVYIYLIDITFQDGEKQHHQGNITLLR